MRHRYLEIASTPSGRAVRAALLSSNDLDIAFDTPIDPTDHVVTLTAPIQLTRVGGEMKFLVNDSSDNRTPDISLLRIVTRANDVQRRLAEDTTLTVHDIAREQGVTPKYLYILLRLRWLAPYITTAIVNGRQPIQCHALDAAAQLPAVWPAQRVPLRTLSCLRVTAHPATTEWRREISASNPRE